MTIEIWFMSKYRDRIKVIIKYSAKQAIINVVDLYFGGLYVLCQDIHLNPSIIIISQFIAFLKTASGNLVIIYEKAHCNYTGIQGYI